MGNHTTRSGRAARLPTALPLISAAVALIALGAWHGLPDSSAATGPAAPAPATEPPGGGSAPLQEVIDVDLGAMYWNDVYKNTLTLQNNCNKTERVQIEVIRVPNTGETPGLWLWLDGSPMSFRVWHDVPPKSSKSLDVEVMPLGAISRTYTRNPRFGFVETAATYPASTTVNGQINVTYTGSSLCKPKTKTFNFHVVFRTRSDNDAPEDR